MRAYIRNCTAGGLYFFTVNLAERRGTTLLVDRIGALMDAFRVTNQDHSFAMPALVVLPDHLHCLWQMPPDDHDFSTRWRLIKSRFSRRIATGERCSPSRLRKSERGLWQRRYWEHLIRDERDYQSHVDYIHFNPVKHGLVERVADWPYSTFHRHVRNGTLPANWAGLKT